eukprot:gene5941-11989_t
MIFLDWEDGHRPGSTSTGTKMAIYENKSSIASVSVFDNLLPNGWCNYAYQYAVKKNNPWGAYVTTEDVLNQDIDANSLRDNNPERAIALIATRALFFNRGSGIIGNDVNRIHGTAVWCLTSTESDSVEYHIDYAELYRYETNIIYPPLYGGTIHISDVEVEDMIGGDFMVNTEGLEHYKRFGYKAALDKNSFPQDLQTNKHWLRIPYCTNRGILCDGNLPHFSTEIKHIATGKRRVILGLNCFTEDVGECCERAPEHKTTTSITSTTTLSPISGDQQQHKNNSSNNNNNNSNRNGGGISVKDIKKNPALARLLVYAAKKMKEKEMNEKE